MKLMKFEYFCISGLQNFLAIGTVNYNRSEKLEIDKRNICFIAGFFIRNSICILLRKKIIIFVIFVVKLYTLIIQTLSVYKRLSIIFMNLSNIENTTAKVRNLNPLTCKTFGWKLKIYNNYKP